MPNREEDLTWPLYDGLVEVYSAAGVQPPSRPVVGLCEIASEPSAISLIQLIAVLAETPRSAVDAIEEVLKSLSLHRMLRNFNARPANDPWNQLDQARDIDLPKVLQKCLGNPEMARPLLGVLWRAAREVGVDATVTPVGMSTDAIKQECSSEILWALQLANQPDRMRQALGVARLLTKPKPRLNLVRRLRDLGDNPTRKRLATLVVDARGAGRIVFSTLAASLRHGARRAAFKGRVMPPNWLSLIENEPADLGRVARKAQNLLVVSPGRVRDCDTERYCLRIADVFYKLTSKKIGYAKPTATSRKGRRPHGKGLEFMLLALRLIDAAATDLEAQRHIDLIRGWRKSSKKKRPV